MFNLFNKLLTCHYLLVYSSLSFSVILLKALLKALYSSIQPFLRFSIVTIAQLTV
nr:MAG TPA: hypothetical protein [Caudoviricetes sp.]